MITPSRNHGQARIQEFAQVCRGGWRSRFIFKSFFQGRCGLNDGEITINFWILSEKCEFHVVVTSHYDQVYEFWFVILQMGIAKYNIGLLEVHVTSNSAFSLRSAPSVSFAKVLQKVSLMANVFVLFFLSSLPITFISLSPTIIFNNGQNSIHYFLRMDPYRYLIGFF